jgi:hypothetical protein
MGRLDFVGNVDFSKQTLHLCDAFTIDFMCDNGSAQESLEIWKVPTASYEYKMKTEVHKYSMHTC